MQLTMAAVAKHVAVQEDIASEATEPAGDRPSGSWRWCWGWCWRHCTHRRKTHILHEVKEWFCSLARVKTDWTIKKGTPILLRTRARGHTPQVDRAGDSWCRSWSPRSSPAAVQNVLWRRSVGRTPELAHGDTWHRLALLHSPVPKIHAVTWVPMASELHGSASRTCVPCTSVRSSWPSIGRRRTPAHIRLVFVPPNTTAVCQPLDRA